MLCPIDFSRGSDHALGLAARIAAEVGAELVIVHAWHVPPIAYREYALPANSLEHAFADEASGLVELAERARAFGVASVSTRVVEGVPSDRIVEIAQADHAFDLIVIGTRGRTGVARWVLGSVAEHVVRHAPCSVLVARGRDEHAPFDHIACPVDFSDHAREAVHQATWLAARGGDGLSLWHVIDPRVLRGVATPDLVADLDRRASLELERWAARIEPAPPVALRCDIRVGDPADEVLAGVEADDSIDLIAVGARSRTGIRRALLGSVAEKLVRHARCPVLVARTRG